MNIRTPKKKKVLVVEAYDHLKVLENIYHLLNNRCQLTYYLNRAPLKKCRSLFPSASNAQISINRIHSILFFLNLLFYAWRYDYINISTGPEGNHFTDIINVIFFYLCCVLYRDKIILTVKNIRPYLESSKGVYSFFRSRAIKKIRRFTFETETMRKIFKKHFSVETALLGTSYDRYTDLINPGMTSVKKSNKTKFSIRIGLLGVVNSNRRNYDDILRTLEKLSVDELNKIEFVTLGQCPGCYDNDVIKAFTRIVKVDCHDGILSAQDFDKRGTSCDILISPLKPDKEYGAFKGSGSFGDAIYLRKKIILPEFTDREKEFKEIGIYYQNHSELLIIFKKIDKILQNDPDESFFETFTTKNVFNKLSRDLRLCEDSD